MAGSELKALCMVANACNIVRRQPGMLAPRLNHGAKLCAIVHETRVRLRHGRWFLQRWGVCFDKPKVQEEKARNSLDRSCHTFRNEIPFILAKMEIQERGESRSIHCVRCAERKRRITRRIESVIVGLQLCATSIG
jgi:hypothetical protein